MIWMRVDNMTLLYVKIVASHSRVVPIVRDIYAVVELDLHVVERVMKR